MLNKPRSRGRPAGHPPTRATILAAARELFLERGYRGTTVRAVAARAGVDQALIGYHFGSKQGLFGEAVPLPCTGSLAVTEAVAGDRAGLPDRLLRAVTDQWDGAAAAPALQSEEVMRVFREYLERELLCRLAEFLGGPNATQRAAAAVAVLTGLIFTRYLNPYGPLVALPAAEVRLLLGPPLRTALYGARPAVRR
ncbi:TetR family transcriptional regulator [Pseudonocardia sp.]|uniref:TetR/AcrR family transcriptional regulator n=1 Tax=Pseudonocardia sp. TaxID=60912 RepID=UPI003D0F148A